MRPFYIPSTTCQPSWCIRAALSFAWYSRRFILSPFSWLNLFPCFYRYPGAIAACGDAIIIINRRRCVRYGHVDTVAVQLGQVGECFRKKRKQVSFVQIFEALMVTNHYERSQGPWVGVPKSNLAYWNRTNLRTEREGWFPVCVFVCWITFSGLWPRGESCWISLDLICIFLLFIFSVQCHVDSLNCVAVHVMSLQFRDWYFSF